MMKGMPGIILEACVETYEQAIAAQEHGAHRIELCSHLEHGGLTPELSLFERLIGELHIPVKVMIRPRPGDFVHSEDEIEIMVHDIGRFKKEGAVQVVTGVLDAQGNVHMEHLAYLAEQAYPLPITFHKAIDETADPLRELERMSDIENVQYILSSGKGATARAGYPVLRAMIEKYGDRYTIIAAGKVTRDNLEETHQLVGAREYHGRKIV
jgi:copper homeostasis protein